MILTATGCINSIMHKAVQWDRCEHGHSVFKCLDCGHEFLEAEDTGCGG